MSAERLREASALMREADDLDPGDRAFVLAVADWLEEVAWRSEHYPKQYRAAKHALAVANAYLGGDS